MGILEDIGLVGNNDIPQNYRQGIPKEQIKAQNAQEGERKYIDNLENANKMLKEQNSKGNLVVDSLEQTIKQKDVRINFLENALGVKDFKEATLINSIFPEMKKLEESIENCDYSDTSFFS